MTASKTVKPLGQKSYGSIGHLPGSRLGVGDHRIPDGQAKILTEKTRDRHDRIIVQEKLDGSNVCVAKIDGILHPLGRAGYPAVSSRFDQHRFFAAWVHENYDRFDALLREGERLCGEWLAQAHGTRYDLQHEPFVAFDLMCGHRRAPYDEFGDRVKTCGFAIPYPISLASPMSIEEVLNILGRRGFHGAIDLPEGAVWRCECRGNVQFLAKYVRTDKQDGCYLPEVSGGEAVWNWRPS